MTMLTPRMADLEPQLAYAARHVAQVLQGAGFRSWLVGGAVRDLCLGRPVKDADLVSAARPEQVQALFPRTVAVGASFGIVVVLVEDPQTAVTIEVEVATFREERGYSDARRPDLVSYTDSPELDARRRDFTCNALYLDPLDDTLLDPTGGAADLRAGRLSTVGEPNERFREDGLRLLRMARFEAALDLEPGPDLHMAARSMGAALRGVSPERVFEELSRMLSGPRPRRALGILEECELGARVFPGWKELSSDERTRRIALLGGPAQGPDSGPDSGAATAGELELGLVVLFDRMHEDPVAGLKPRLEALRVSRGVLRAALDIAALQRSLPELAEAGARVSARLRAMRSPWFSRALGLAQRAAFLVQEDTGSQILENLKTLEVWASRAVDPCPAPYITPADLAAAGCRPGPLYGQVLREAEDAQLEGQLDSRTAALVWLTTRLAAIRPN